MLKKYYVSIEKTPLSFDYGAGNFPDCSEGCIKLNPGISADLDASKKMYFGSS